MKRLESEVASLLFEQGAIKFATQPGEFKLKLHETQPDAPLSPIYLNLRTADHPAKPGPLTDVVMTKIGRLLDDRVHNRIDFDHFVGIPEAGEPFADELERAFTGWPSAPTRLRLRKEQLGEGKRRIGVEVEGVFLVGATVLVIDDLITQADSKLETIAALEGQGLIVQHVLVLVDRMQGGKEQLEARGYTLVAIFTLDELLAHYVREGYISQQKSDEVTNYIRANRL